MNFDLYATAGYSEEHRQLLEVSQKTDLEPARAAIVPYDRPEKWPDNERYRGKGWALPLLTLAVDN